MKIGFRTLITFFILFLFAIAAQGQSPVQFNFNKEDRGNGNFILKITAKLPPGVKLFSVKKATADQPVSTIVSFDTSASKYLKDSITESGQEDSSKIAGLNNIMIRYFTDSVIWQQKIKLSPGDSTRVKGLVNYYYVKGDAVEAGEQKISVELAYAAEIKTNDVPPVNQYADKPFMLLVIFGIGFGLLAFITPCVYALVPVTVSLFLKRSKTAAQGRRNVLVYAASIMLIYAAIGGVASVFGGHNGDFWYKLSTNWIFNLVLFLMFLAFALSFLGAFDINLPSSWANKLDKRANHNSYLGIFFMAFTLVVVSFSCTGPFVGSILALSGGAAGRFGPLGGMFGFGLGLTLPFFVFAFFPKMLIVLTKSGGWQNALKVTLGFIELALALKFLSNVDGDRNWRILDREVFLVLWVIIFTLLGIYLLGKIKFKHDSGLPRNDFDLEYLPVPRLLLALTSLAFALYMVPGLWGAPLKAISGFLPGSGTQDFSLNGSNQGNHENPVANNPSGVFIAPKKHVASLSRFEPSAAINNKLSIYYDYEEAMAVAKKLKKPLMLDFTGIQCVNCRKFEGEIWTDPKVGTLMKNDFVIVSLFTDFNDELPDAEKYHSKLLENKVETVGDRNKDLELKLIGTVEQPNYVFLDTDEKLLTPKGYPYDPTKTATDFSNHLEMVKAEFKKRFP